MLAFWTGGDTTRIDTLFRESGLYREKWERKDYRDRTIMEAQSGKTEFYDAPKTGAWVHIPTEEGLPSNERLASICLDGEHWRTDGSPLSELLEILDETQERLRQGVLSEAC